MITSFREKLEHALRESNEPWWISAGIALGLGCAFGFAMLAWSAVP